MQFFENFLRNSKSESMPRPRCSGTIDFVETIEDMGKVFFRYSYTRISDSQSIILKSESDFSRFLSEFLCIRYDISQSREEECFVNWKHYLSMFDDLYTRIILSERVTNQLRNIYLFRFSDIIASKEKECIDYARKLFEYSFSFGYTILSVGRIFCDVE